MLDIIDWETASSVTRILVVLRGGNIESVGCTGNCEVAIIDWDNIIEGGDTTKIEYDYQDGVPETELNEEIDHANEYINKNE